MTTTIFPATETDPQPAGPALAGLRQNLRGVWPLDARVEPWMTRVLTGRDLPGWVERWGSPLNLLSRSVFERNLQSLRRVGADRGLNSEVYFARKANKAMGFVEACKALGAGVDTASYEELRQAIDAGVPPDKLICTAAIKEPPLLRLCAQHGVTVAIDNLDELDALTHCAAGRPTPIALRVGGFLHQGEHLTTRFGFDIAQAMGVARERLAASDATLRLRGVQFHLDGYCPQQRVSAIAQSIGLIQALRAEGHAIDFLDIGGGLPVCYLEHPQQWDDFWRAHRAALLGGGPGATYRDHSLGLTVDGDRLLGEPNVYPFYQPLDTPQWLDSILTAMLPGSRTVAATLAALGLQLRCEPGRALMDGCGMTVARVVHRKRLPGGDLLVGLSMNRTQCRTGSDDFLVDPLLVPLGGARRGAQTETGDGYLTGAYCTESEAILLRKLRFSAGVAVGDLIALPNTAGYFMHFYESRSHQFPLAENRFVEQIDART